MPIIIGKRVWAAAEVFFYVGLGIGDGVVISSTSAVTKDMPDWMFCSGNPCNPIKP
jgi:putative colanic acid biosynthesis acetyltransferase WcaF